MVAKEPEVKMNELPAHLYKLRGGEWAMWRWVALRGAGFAARKVLEIADPDCAAAADSLNSLEAEAGRTKKMAISALKEERNKVDASERELINTTLSSLKSRQLDISLVNQNPAPLRDALKSHLQTQSEIGSETQNYRLCFDNASLGVSKRLYRIAEMNRFREAVIWQNRRALHTGINYLLRHPSYLRPTSRNRRQEKLIASYLQRYCTKNDTIGFFNPVGWAKIVDQGTLIVKPGENLVADRRVYFEGWCIDALCAAISADRKLQAWIAPRRMCFIHLEGSTLHLPARPPVKLSNVIAAVLGACDGLLSAKEIAKNLIAREDIGIKDEGEVYAILEQLERKQLIVWTLETAPESFPERSLRQCLERLDDAALRMQAIAPLDELEEARARVAAAAGNAVELDEAIENFEKKFTLLTGESPTRDDGETYAARTLIYEDCRRDIDVEIGPKIIGEIEAPLLLLLASARWFTYQVALEYRKSLEEIYSQIARKAGTQVIDFTTLWYRVQPLFFSKPYRIIEKLKAEFRSRWAEILPYSNDQKEACFKTSDITSKVLTLFAAPDSGWSLARYHSPDILIAAADLASIQRGDYKPIIGEIHLGANTLLASLFLNQHPAPQELRAAIDSDFSAPKVLIVIPKSHETGQTLRLLPELACPGDFHLKITPEPPLESQFNTIPIGELVVEKVGEDLIIRTRDRRAQFDLLEAFGEILSRLVDGGFRMVRPSDHIPRISIDNLVVWRESWSIPVSELAFAYLKDNRERYRAARGWAKGKGVPRFVFIRSPLETKPLYLDFDSPISVDLFSRVIRHLNDMGRNQRIHMNEMLPTIEQTWLIDCEGNQYTSELRIACLDLNAQGDNRNALQ